MSAAADVATDAVGSGWVQVILGSGAIAAGVKWLAGRYAAVEAAAEQARERMMTQQAGRIAQQDIEIEELRAQLTETQRRLASALAQIAVLTTQVARLGHSPEGGAPQ